ncbi:MAG: RnfABCDGE type electron transport complex subunit D [Candidatus Dadabacteria bacterium]|nr:MAG: RnfABCDGE type electron transport complex subunit D [Candidatus Dadabacteria bacterium]
MEEKVDRRYLNLSVRTSPHIKRGVTVPNIMANVVLALVPISAHAVYAFGLSALLLIASTTASCLLTEYFINRVRGVENTLSDFSAVITGMLLGLTLPPGFPLWMGCVGGVVSIALGKSLFGGLGYNVFNPALVGRAFLQAAFPVAITTWHEPFQLDRFVSLIPSTLTVPFSKPIVEGVTGATPLALMKFDHKIVPLDTLLLGVTGGSIGELSALIILICGVYLAFRRMLDWRIPVGMTITVVLLCEALRLYNPAYPSGLFMVTAGGFMLGAWFMATDMVTSPVTPLAVWIFSIIVGVLIVVIRLFGGLPEGVMYAILIGNAVTPLLNEATQPKVYGTG